MDSHYDQVMKAREGAKENAPRLYFAYSTILDRKAFNVWKSEHAYEFFNLPEGALAEALDLDLVYDFPSRWWGGRVAGLVEKSGATIFGRLYEIAAVDWPIICHKEGAVTGMSIEKTVKVSVAGKVLEATAFTTAPQRASSEGPISTKFKEALLSGAEQASLPASYIDRLRHGP